MIQIHFGKSSIFELSIREQDEFLVGTSKPPIRNIVAEILKSLDSPLDFPQIVSAIVPGDRIAIVLAPSVPQPAKVLLTVVQYLLDHQVASHQIYVILATDDSEALELSTAVMDQCGSPGISVTNYSGRAKSDQAYIGADETADPIYVCREIHEADVVIPIVCIQDPTSFDYSPSKGIVPWFVDPATQRRWRSLSNQESFRHGINQSHRTALGNQIAQLVGVYFLIGIVPGNGQEAIAILCGDPNRVNQLGATIIEEARPRLQLDNPDLVVAAIPGGQAEQTWENVVRCIEAAREILTENGTIAICTELEAPLGPAMRQLVTLDSDDKLAQWLARSDEPDAMLATALLTARKQCRIYLTSRLNRESLEEIGLSTIENQSELQHLLDASSRCLIIETAQNRGLMPRKISSKP